MTPDLRLDLAPRLPQRVRFGTSSWTYPGWRGVVYSDAMKDEKVLAARGLSEYSKFPWFRCVGVDSTFYAPPRASTFQNYARQLPEGFPLCCKVWEHVTAPRFGRHARYGAHAGQTNPTFLDAGLFRERVLSVHEAPEIRARTGPFLLEFQSLGRASQVERDDFLERLDAFLGAVSGPFRLAVEIRTPALLVPRYFAILNHHGVTHVFNHWDRMPPLIEQMRAAASAGGLQADFYVARLLTPLGVDYESAVERFQPYDRLQERQLGMRDDVARLIGRALERDVDAIVLVNNRVEGHAPGTIAEIGERVMGAATGTEFQVRVERADRQA